MSGNLGSPDTRPFSYFLRFLSGSGEQSHAWQGRLHLDGWPRVRGHVQKLLKLYFFCSGRDPAQTADSRVLVQTGQTSID